MWQNWGAVEHPKWLSFCHLEMHHISMLWVACAKLCASRDLLYSSVGLVKCVFSSSYFQACTSAVNESLAGRANVRGNCELPHNKKTALSLWATGWQNDSFLSQWPGSFSLSLLSLCWGLYVSSESLSFVKLTELCWSISVHWIMESMMCHTQTSCYKPFFFIISAPQECVSFFFPAKLMPQYPSLVWFFLVLPWAVWGFLFGLGWSSCLALRFQVRVILLPLPESKTGALGGTRYKDSTKSGL